MVDRTENPTFGYVNGWFGRSVKVGELLVFREIRLWPPSV